MYANNFVLNCDITSEVLFYFLMNTMLWEQELEKGDQFGETEKPQKR